jgi:hypothetical protein
VEEEVGQMESSFRLETIRRTKDLVASIAEQRVENERLIRHFKEIEEQHMAMTSADAQAKEAQLAIHQERERLAAGWVCLETLSQEYATEKAALLSQGDGLLQQLLRASENVAAARAVWEEEAAVRVQAELIEAAGQRAVEELMARVLAAQAVREAVKMEHNSMLSDMDTLVRQLGVLQEEDCRDLGKLQAEATQYEGYLLGEMAVEAHMSTNRSNRSPKDWEEDEIVAEWEEKSARKDLELLIGEMDRQLHQLQRGQSYPKAQENEYGGDTGRKKQVALEESPEDWEEDEIVAEWEEESARKDLELLIGEMDRQLHQLQRGQSYRKAQENECYGDAGRKKQVALEEFSNVSVDNYDGLGFDAQDLDQNHAVANGSLGALTQTVLSAARTAALSTIAASRETWESASLACESLCSSIGKQPKMARVSARSALQRHAQSLEMIGRAMPVHRARERVRLAKERMLCALWRDIAELQAEALAERDNVLTRLEWTRKVLQRLIEALEQLKWAEEEVKQMEATWRHEIEALRKRKCDLLAGQDAVAQEREAIKTVEEALKQQREDMQAESQVVTDKIAAMVTEWQRTLEA